VPAPGVSFLGTPLGRATVVSPDHLPVSSPDREPRRKAAYRAGLGKVSPHDLRRSFSSLAGRRGMDPNIAANITGHSLATYLVVRLCQGLREAAP
jgi:integrase